MGWLSDIKNRKMCKKAAEHKILPLFTFPNGFVLFPICNLLCGSRCTRRTGRAGCTRGTRCTRRAGRAGRARGSCRTGCTRGAGGSRCTRCTGRAGRARGTRRAGRAGLSGRALRSPGAGRPHRPAQHGHINITAAAAAAAAIVRVFHPFLLPSVRSFRSKPRFCGILRHRV